MLSVVIRSVHMRSVVMLCVAMLCGVMLWSYAECRYAQDHDVDLSYRYFLNYFCILTFSSSL